MSESDKNIVKRIIDKFQLTPHREGGYFRLLYEDEMRFKDGSLPKEYVGERSFWNGIYYLLLEGEYSIFHRIKMCELWNFYLGSPLELFEIDSQGNLKKTVLGNDAVNLMPAHVVQKKHWMAAKPLQGFSFVSCITAPGFTFDDWEQGNRNDLIALFPQHKETILKFTNP